MYMHQKNKRMRSLPPPSCAAAVPPHTRRCLGFNSKAGRAASAALTVAAMVDDRMVRKAASAAVSRAGGRR